jgi:hypothetical protein
VQHASLQSATIQKLPLIHRPVHSAGQSLIQMIRLAFVIRMTRVGRRGDGDKNPNKYTSLPVCSKVIVATSPNRVPTFAEWQKSQEKNGDRASPPKP